MATTKIRGNTQIMAGTITNAELNSAAGITLAQLALGAELIQRDGSVAFTQNINAGSHKIINVTDPSSAQDAATKAYVDNVAQGAAPKGGTRVMANTNITLSGTQTIDGIALSAGDLVLLTGQTTGSQNGPWIVSAGAWTRPLNFDNANDAVKGAYWLVNDGTNFGGTGWQLTTYPYTIDTTTLALSQIFGPGDIIDGAGLIRTGNTFNIGANADSSIVVNANDIQVKRDGAGAIGVSAAGIAVALGANTGLVITSNTLGIKLDGASLTLSANGIKVTNPIPTVITRETPTGLVNGSNVTYTLANTPTAGSEEVFVNGVLQEPGAGNDYTISSATITMLTALLTGDKIRVSYRF